MVAPQNRKWRLANRALLLQTLAFLASLYASPTQAPQSLLAYCGGVSITLGFYAGANVWQDKVTKAVAATPEGGTS